MANFQPLPSFPGEPVDTHLQADTPDYAPWIRRAGAYVIDGAFGVAVATAIAIATGHHNPFNTFSWHLVNGKEQLRPIGSKLLFFNATVIGVEVIYTIGFFVSTWQATLGMRLLGIFIARESDHGKVVLGRATIRTVFFLGASALLQAVLKALASLIFLADYLWPLWDARNQTLHDKVAKTVVLRRITER